MSETLILTEEEEKLTTYCEDFCPIYQAITDYNRWHRPTVSCPSVMCERIVESYVLNRRSKEQ
ncbi:MAG: hypothetical protein IJA10_11240 [Lachnospiraceae bacterium]|nr:hypothetical protein [Lachnospiraceae bacterium]